MNRLLRDVLTFLVMVGGVMLWLVVLLAPAHWIVERVTPDVGEQAAILSGMLWVMLVVAITAVVITEESP